MSLFGCCDDQITFAKGPNQEGCSRKYAHTQICLLSVFLILLCYVMYLMIRCLFFITNFIGLLSKCEQLRSIPRHSFSLSFRPQCDKKGHFNSIQCWNTVNQCWCVNNDGRELKGTRVHGKKPDCSAGVYRCFFFTCM